MPAPMKIKVFMNEKASEIEKQVNRMAGDNIGLQRRSHRRKSEACRCGYVAEKPNEAEPTRGRCDSVVRAAQSIP